MPTGYTSKIQDGQTFIDFAMDCAKAFGACITMRDMPSNAKIPKKFKHDDYYEKKVKEGEKELAKIRKMTCSQCDKEAAKEYDDRLQECNDIIEERKKLKLKYEKMLSEAVNYVVPSEKHFEFRQFMIDQIKDSIRFDCDDDYYTSQIAQLRKVSGEAWQMKKIDDLVHSIEYDKIENYKAIERNNERNEWIELLRKSLEKHETKSNKKK